MSEPNKPGSYPRRALVCVAGLSPAVITETIYALATQAADPFVPTEVHVVTTRQGRDRVREQLLAEPGGALLALRREYLEPNPIDFKVCVIRRNGAELDDIQTPEDSTAAADTILGLFRDLALDPDCAIHGSIAGGRKSMSFLLGNCMALVGRPQDRVSHVLVNEPFDSPALVPRFYFPPRTPIECRMGNLVVNTAEARITLAMIDVVRVFDGIDRVLVSERTSYDELVQQSRKALLRPRLRVVPSRRVVQLSDLTCQLQPQEAFFYTLLALRRANRAQEAGVHPAKVGAVVVRENGRSVGLDGPWVAMARRRLDMENADADLIRNIRPLVSNINRKLRAAFGPALAARALIVGPDRQHRDGHYGLLGVMPEDLHFG